jgi:hypothetical protein
LQQGQPAPSPHRSRVWDCPTSCNKATLSPRTFHRRLAGVMSAAAVSCRGLLWPG